MKKDDMQEAAEKLVALYFGVGSKFQIVAVRDGHTYITRCDGRARAVCLAGMEVDRGADFAVMTETTVTGREFVSVVVSLAGKHEWAFTL